MDLAVKLATGKSVLHVGCVDEGMTGRETLHQKLGKVAAELIGVDVVAGADCIHDFQVKEWSESVQTNLTPDWTPMKTKFDIVICTEVLEHLDCVGPFLRNLRSVGAKEYFFSVPNAFSLQHNDTIRYPYLQVIKGNNRVETIPTELVHEDHRCWFSPYTLENVLRKAGYEPKEKFMLGWGDKPASIFTAEGVGILAQ